MNSDGVSGEIPGNFFEIITRRIAFYEFLVQSLQEISEEILEKFLEEILDEFRIKKFFRNL